MPLEDVEKIVRNEPIGNYYDVGNELGRGKFAIVKRCTEKATGTQFAAKVLKKRRHGRSVRADILVEIDIMRQANGSGKQPRIIKLYEVFESANEFHIVLELATGGELFRVIAIDPLPEEKAREVVYQILDGVQHLHTLNIVHLDLKPENILLFRKGSLDIKIADFGLSVQVREGQEMKNLVGTAEYVSPEILSFDPLSTFSDMWSIGALTYALITGYSPFQGETHQETFLNVSMCDYDFDDELFDQVSTEAKEFIEKLLIQQPKKRLTAAKCLQHPWMKARTTLNSSTSSLDSAVCVDSASSIEPSPVSSASSSFSPAPPSTTHTTASTTASASSLSQPEDMRRVNQKLSEISALATQSFVAESNVKQQVDDSPTSTDSSTSTLKGDESFDNVPPKRDFTSPTSKEEGKKYKYDRVSKESKSYSSTDGLAEEKKNKTIESTVKSSDIDSLSTRSKYSSRYGIDSSSDSKSYAPKTSELSDNLLSSKRTSSRTNSVETTESPRADRYSTRRSYEPRYKMDSASSPSALDKKTESTKTSLEADKSKESRTTSLEKKDPVSDGTYKTRLGSRTTSLEKTSSDSTHKTRLGSRTTSLEKTSSDSTHKTRLGSRTTSLEKESSPTSKYSSRTISLEEDYATYKSRFISRKTSSDNETTSSTTKPRSGIRTTSIESDTDYNSSSSRSSSLETAPLPRKHSTEKAPLGIEKSSSYSDISSPYKSTTLDRSYKSSYTSSTYKSRNERDKLSDYSSRSHTLDRKSNVDINSYTSRSSTLDRKSTSSSRQTASNKTSLGSAAAQDREMFNRIKRDHQRPVTPEPESPGLTGMKLLHSPEIRSRRKSEGNHPINHQVGKFLRTSETLHEGDEEVEHSSNKKENKEEKEEEREEEKKEENEEKKEDISQPSSRSVSPNKPYKSSSDKYTSCTFQSTIGRTPVESAWGNFRTERGTSKSSFRIKHKDDDSWLSKRHASTSPMPVRRKSDVDNQLDVEKQLTTQSCDSSPKSSPPGTPTSPSSSKDKLGGSRSSTPSSPTNAEKGIRSPTSPLSPKSPRYVSGESSEKTREKMTSPIEKRNRERDVCSPVELRRSQKGSSSETESPQIVLESSKDTTPPPSSITVSSTSSSSSVRTRLTTSPARDFRRQRSPDPEKVKQLKADRRKTPIISPEALDMLLSGNLPDEDSLETCQEEDEGDISSPEHKSSSILKTKSLDTCPMSPPSEKKVSINTDLVVVVNAPTPTVDSKPLLGENGNESPVSSEANKRSKSLGNFSPEPDSSPVSPEGGDSPFDAFSRSMDLRRSSRDRLNRLRGNSFSNSLSMSLSMTDLSDIGKKETKARRVGRSNSRRLLGRSKVDSYVTDSRMSPSHQYATGSITSSTKTLPGRLLSGKSISAWRSRDRDASKKSEKSKYRLW